MPIPFFASIASSLAGGGGPAGPAAQPGAPISSAIRDNTVSSGAKVFNTGGNPNAGLAFGGPAGNQLLSLGTDPTSATAAISRNIIPLMVVVFAGLFLLKATGRK